jgi:hypothetical protein
VALAFPGALAAIHLKVPRFVTPAFQAPHSSSSILLKLQMTFRGAQAHFWLDFDLSGQTTAI